MAPPLRPVCGANVGQGTRLGEVLCIVLERVADTIPSESEIVSTEELCHKIVEANKELKGLDWDNKQLIVGSLDVKALYPSLEVADTSEICKNMVEESDIKFEVDSEALGRYIRLAVEDSVVKEEGIDMWCPKRKVTRGSVPTIMSNKYNQTRGKGPNLKELNCWAPPEVAPTTPAQVRKMMAVALREAIKTFMSHHTYQFGGQLKVQEEGGSIGAALTVQLSRVTMRYLDIQFKKGVEREMRALNLNTRYVDDMLVAIIWDIIQNMDKVEVEKLVMDKMRMVADNVLRMLNFTVDYPGSSEVGWMPVLDLQVRTEGNQIQFMYYEKPCSNNMVIGERSAMSSSTKRTVLIQEGLRRLLNTSPDLPDHYWRGIMEDFACKM